MLRLNVKTAEVRDIATILSMPALAKVRSPKHPYLNLREYLVKNWEIKLEALDEHWDTRPETSSIKRINYTRLGIYYEKLLTVLFAELTQGLRVVDSNIQLNNEKRTLGELDFLIETRRGDCIHLEVAIKFYLFSVLDNRRYCDNSLWLGTNRRDNLKKKTDYMLQVQLEHTEKPEVQDFLQKKNLKPSAASWLLQGLLFLPVKRHFNVSEQRYMNGNICHSWVQLSMFKKLKDDLREFDIIALEKRDWIGGNFCASATTTFLHHAEAVDYISVAITAIPDGAPIKSYPSSHRSVMLQLIPKVKKHALLNDRRLLVVEDRWL